VNSWPKVSLGEVFDISRGGSPRPIQKFLTQDPNGINWVMIGDALENSKYISSTKNRIIEEGVKKSRMVQSGDFLLTNSMSFGKPYIMNTSGCIHDGWLVLSPSGYDVDPDFFYYLLGSDFMYTEFTRRAAGATVKNLNINLVKGVNVTLPPLEEQKRIAGILDAADILRAKRREALAKLDDLLQSTFLDLFGDPVTNPKGWEVKTLKEVAPAKSSKASFQPNELVWHLNLDQIESQSGQVFNKIYDLASEAGSSTHVFDTGNVLYSKLRPYLNKVVCPDSSGIATTELVPLRPIPGQIDRSYLTYFLRSQQFVRWVSNAVAGAKMPRVSMKVFWNHKLPTPPPDLQHHFAEIVSSVEEQKAKMRKHLEQLDDLFASLQQRAFRGDL